MKAEGKMSFRDFVFPVNPSLIRIVHDRNISRHQVPFGSSMVSDMGTVGRTIYGEGEFFGENCEKDFAQLLQLYRDGYSGILYIPSQKPLCAYLKQLEWKGSDIEGVIQYRFCFVENFEKMYQACPAYAVGNGKKCLWDFSYEYSVPVEEILSLNPDIHRPDESIKSGKRVYLC